MRHLILLLLGGALAACAFLATGCALPPNDGTGGFATASGESHLMNHDCVASGTVHNNGATSTVGGRVFIDCEPVPATWHVVISLQWSPVHADRGQPRVWSDEGGSQVSTEPVPDATGEFYSGFSAPCIPGRWREEIVADGTTHDGHPRSDTVHQPHPPVRIRNCHADFPALP